MERDIANEEEPSMLRIVESKKPLDRVAKNLEAAVTRDKSGVLGVHDLKETVAAKAQA